MSARGRSSKDFFKNPRDRSLVNQMETNEFMLLNGRSMSDSPAQFTFDSRGICIRYVNSKGF